MPLAVDPDLAFPALLGLVAGLALLIRGMRGHLVETRLADTSSSPIASIAAGEVRVSGVVEPAELTLTSPLQSATCVYYRARIRERTGRSETTVFREEVSVGFRVRDATGALRVFPRGAQWDVPDRLDGSTGFAGEDPPDLRLRDGPRLQPADPSREELVARLLTVHRPPTSPGELAEGSAGGLSALGRGGRHYQEARIQPGDAVTILGRVLPYSELEDAEGTDLDEAIGGPLAGTDDPEVAADLAAARAAGTLAADPATAWGNAAIPGFGIGHPVTAPHLDPGATPVPVATPEERARFERAFDIEPATLVLAASAEVPLLIAAGPPAAAVERQRRRMVVGLLGALLAIGSAGVLAASLPGLLR